MANTQIQILSDLHLETPTAYDIYTIEPRAPFLTLLGDIGYVKDGEGYFLFLRRQLQLFQIVFLVLGNHEPYHSSWTETKARVNRFKDEINHDDNDLGRTTCGKLVLLDQTRYDISPTLTVLGCTLFSRIDPAQEERVSFGLNDFYHIRDWTTESHQEAHVADVAWLNNEVTSISTSEPDRKIIVLTHYCPSTQQSVVDPRHENSPISSGFMTDLSDEECWRCDNVRLWAFGHTHFNCDFQDTVTGKKNKKKRVVANQRGYYFAQSAGFDSEKVIDLDGL